MNLYDIILEFWEENNHILQSMKPDLEKDNSLLNEYKKYSNIVNVLDKILDILRDEEQNLTNDLKEKSWDKIFEIKDSDLKSECGSEFKSRFSISNVLDDLNIDEKLEVYDALCEFWNDKREIFEDLQKEIQNSIDEYVFLKLQSQIYIFYQTFLKF